eukprot:TRINITY_DN21151_c0_g1_i2.p1 TRINITY_DN21151_c0_g1~~TRINITY_DN21151_c0_g1_i2.p1  ORF type:complete len:114 (+),score=5.23 TRINITY_DN21151_c0_g1_i2:218-559(+)
MISNASKYPPSQAKQCAATHHPMMTTRELSESTFGSSDRCSPCINASCSLVLHCVCLNPILQRVYHILGNGNREPQQLIFEVATGPPCGSEQERLQVDQQERLYSEARIGKFA